VIGRPGARVAATRHELRGPLWHDSRRFLLPFHSVIQACRIRRSRLVRSFRSPRVRRF